MTRTAKSPKILTQNEPVIVPYRANASGKEGHGPSLGAICRRAVLAGLPLGGAVRVGGHDAVHDGDVDPGLLEHAAVLEHPADAPAAAGARPHVLHEPGAAPSASSSAAHTSPCTRRIMASNRSRTDPDPPPGPVLPQERRRRLASGVSFRSPPTPAPASPARLGAGRGRTGSSPAPTCRRRRRRGLAAARGEGQGLGRVVRREGAMSCSELVAVAWRGGLYRGVRSRWRVVAAGGRRRRGMRPAVLRWEESKGTTRGSG